MNSHWKQNTCALLAAFIWGTAFVAQAVSADRIEPFTFNALRSLVATAVLGGFLLIRKGVHRIRKIPTTAREPGSRKRLWLGGLCCGALLAIAANLQQFGIGGSGAGKAGFLTALYIVIVPVLGIFFRRRVPATVWISVVIAVAGLYFLCISGSFTLAASDLFLLLCAAAFAVQILTVDHVSAGTNPIELSCVQFLFVTLFSAVPALFTEHTSVQAISECILPILYVGVFSSGVAYTLQIIAQKNSNPTVISLLLSLEAFFSAAADAVLLHHFLSPREYLGCGLMLTAVLLAQLPPIGRKRKAKQRE